MSTDLQATSSGAHPVPNSAHDDVFNSLMPSFRKNPLPATIIGFDYSGEVETDELFWHVAAKKGFTPDDFGQKTLADFGGPGVTPHVQKKRWDVWVANRNKNIKSVLQARHAVVKHKNYFGYNALLSNARTPRSPQAPGKTLEHTKQVSLCDRRRAWAAYSVVQSGEDSLPSLCEGWACKDTIRLWPCAKM